MFEIQMNWSPVLALIFLLAALFVPYTIGVCSGHVRAWFPFIHELGANDPDRCVFTALLNLVALLLFVNVNDQRNVINEILVWQTQSSYLYGFSFWCGALACFGLFLMANFPAINNKLPFFIHCCGAVLFFCGSPVYCGILTLFSYNETKYYDENWFPFIIRCQFLFLYLIALIGYIVFWYFGKSQPQKVIIKISALCQWLLPITVIAFFLTYEMEFWKLHGGQIHHKITVNRYQKTNANLKLSWD
ncbi:DNA damage-regulated autophagy modulator protein 2 [Holothuria leucospilota]|uniref:DNA damage-regulated autophagy modulator protein 2 n=1 Tax=Holothuria leucospilota TaxID=206669 RepID=A0A9Q1BGW1_HOLLE|nr:DNA damage-regulated autophagy modulator protein 2 [Holothuria leucospilota]